MGRRKRPFYRIVAIDSRTRRDGREIERLGWFDPLNLDVAVNLKEDRIIHWLNKGAQPSETVENIIREIGLKYKIHLIHEGKTEDELAALLTAWQIKQEEKRNKKIEKRKAKKEAIAKAKQDEISAGAAGAAEEVKAEEEVAEESPAEESPAKEIKS